MSIESGLIADIIENPDDDRLRLIYADWLEDGGHHERAEFIRLDLAKERGGPLAPEDRERRRKLYQEHHQRWSSDIDRLVRRRVYRRGLVESVYLSGEQYCRGASALGRLAPVREVSFCDPVEPRRVASTPAPACLSSLNLTGCVLPPGSLLDLAGSSHLAGLVSLEMSGRIDLPGLRSLLASPALSGLRRLTLTRYWFHHNVGGLVGEKLGRLRELDLKGSWLGESGARTLAESPHLAPLKVLGLRSVALSDAAAAVLARSPHLAGLERLDVRFNYLSAQGRGLLAERFGDRVVLD